MTRALAIIVVLVTAPALALAKPRVALVPVENDASGDVQDAIVDALDGGELTLVGPKQVARTVDKLGLEGELSDKQIKKLANELEADAVVQSSVSSKGANKVLHFKLFVGGKKQKGFRIEFGSAKSAKFKSALHDKMVEKLGDAGGSAKKDDDDKPPTKKKKGSKAEDDDADKPAAKKKKGSKAEDDDADKPVAKKKKGAAEDDDADKPVAKKKKGAAEDDDADKPKKSAGGDDDTAAAGDDDRPKTKRTAHAGDDDADGDVSVHAKIGLGADATARPANRAAIRVDAGVSLTGRSLTFATRTFTEGIGNPKPYKNSPVPGARVEGAVYPLAVGDPMAGGLAGLGVAGLYDKTFSLGLHNSLMPATTYKANEFRWDVGARYRLVFGAKPTSPSVTAGIDYGHRQFKITNRPTPDSGIVIDIPDVEYVGITPNVELRVPIVSAVALVAGGGSFLALRAGAVQNPEQYGKATITEFQAYGGLDIVFSKRMAIRLTGDFAQFGFKFTGTGAMANDRDGDSTSKDVGGALDRYFGGAATFGVLY